jgi:hypothetical protein
MASLHDPADRAALERRLASLTPASHRRWGTMSVDQMLHHVNHALRSALGREPGTLEVTLPLPKPVLKFLVLHMPWPRGTPTAPEWIAAGRYDFDDERRQAMALIAELAARPLNGEWPRHTTFGDVGGQYWSRINAKHLDHHLKQFNG